MSRHRISVEPSEKMRDLLEDSLSRHGVKGHELLDVLVNADAGSMEVTLGIPDIADWHLRYAVLEAAAALEQDYDYRVRCFFRSVDDTQDLVTD